MSARIRFRRIQEFAENVIGRTIKIHITTELQRIIAMSTIDRSGRVDILINANICKTEEDVLVAVAHELAHIVLGEKEHSEEFEEKVKELLEKISKTFNIKRNKLIATKKKLDKIAGREVE